MAPASWQRTPQSFLALSIKGGWLFFWDKTQNGLIWSCDRSLMEPSMAPFVPPIIISSPYPFSKSKSCEEKNDQKEGRQVQDYQEGIQEESDTRCRISCRQPICHSGEGCDSEEVYQEEGQEDCQQKEGIKERQEEEHQQEEEMSSHLWSPDSNFSNPS